MPWCWVRRAGSTTDVLSRSVPGRRRAGLAPDQRRRDGRRGAGHAQCLGDPAGNGRAGVIGRRRGAWLRPGLDRPVDCGGGRSGHARGPGRPGARRSQMRRQCPAAAQGTGSWSTARSSTILPSSGSTVTWPIPRRQPDYRQGRSHHEFLRNLGLPRNILDGGDRGPERRARRVPGGARSAQSFESLMAEKFANQSVDRAILKFWRLFVRLYKV